MFCLQDVLNILQAKLSVQMQSELRASWARSSEGIGKKLVPWRQNGTNLNTSSFARSSDSAVGLNEEISGESSSLDNIDNSTPYVLTPFWDEFVTAYELFVRGLAKRWNVTDLQPPKTIPTAQSPDRYNIYATFCFKHSI